MFYGLFSSQDKCSAGENAKLAQNPPDCAVTFRVYCGHVNAWCCYKEESVLNLFIDLFSFQAWPVCNQKDFSYDIV